VKVTGDLNNDGEANLTDAILALKVLSGIDTRGLIRPDYDEKVDADGDDRIGLSEAIYGLQVAAELR